MSPAILLFPALSSLLSHIPASEERFWEFFTANIRNPHTRRAYLAAIRRLLCWISASGWTLSEVRPLHVAAYVELLGRDLSKPSVKQHLAAVKTFFDWMVTGGHLPINPAASVRGPRHSVKRGKTPVLAPEEMGELLNAIDTEGLKGLRDRALIATMAYTFARVGAVISLRAVDYYVQGRRSWVRLQEKGGKVNEMPCHPRLETYLEDWLVASGLTNRNDSPLFPTIRNGTLTQLPLHQSNVYELVRQRGAAAGIRTRINCHSFRATGITAYLKSGGRLEIAQRMAGHESARTTGLYDRRDDEIEFEEVARIAF